jgi:hypothetical protein
MNTHNRSTALVAETSRSGTATRRKSTVVADSSDDADDRDDRDDRANNNNNDDDDDDDDFKSANDDVEIRPSRKRESTSGHVSTTKRRVGSASASSDTLYSGTSAGRRAPLASASAPHARSSASVAAASSAGSSMLRFDNDTSDNNDDDDDDTDDDALVRPHTRTSSARATSGRDTQRPAASDSMSCPICGDDFPASEIEAHADVCASQLDGSFNADVRDIPAKSRHSRSGVSVRHVQTTIDGSDGKLKRPSPAAAAAGER